jgi:putative spermidine/putrescine transport system substrate-binding protein
LDTWMMSAKAKHPNCAYKWWNYISSPSVQAQQANFYGETPVNKKACSFMNKISKGSCATYKANAPDAYYRSIKFWKTPVADCGDSRGKVCTSYTKWVQAWTQVKS